MVHTSIWYKLYARRAHFRLSVTFLNRTGLKNSVSIKKICNEQEVNKWPSSFCAQSISTKQHILLQWLLSINSIYILCFNLCKLKNNDFSILTRTTLEVFVQIRMQIISRAKPVMYLPWSIPKLPLSQQQRHQKSYSLDAKSERLRCLKHWNTIGRYPAVSLILSKMFIYDSGRGYMTNSELWIKSWACPYYLYLIG